MGEVASFLVPVVELLGVIVLSIVLVSAIVYILVAILRLLADKELFSSYPALVALRILVGHRERRRLVPVSAQNFIAMVGTAIGVWALIVVLSVMGGFESDLKSKIVRNSPHILIEPESKEPSIVATMSESLSEVPHVVIAEPFLNAEAMVTSSYNMMPGVVVFGIAPGRALEEAWLARVASPLNRKVLANPVLVVSDREMGFLRESNVENRFDNSEIMPPIPTSTSQIGRVLPGVLLGVELARSLSVEIGDVVTFIVPDGDIGPLGVKPRTRDFRMAGVFETGIYEYDLKTVYMTDRDAANLFLLEGPNVVALMLDDIANLDVAVSKAEEIVANLGGGDVRTVAQMNRSLFSALKVEKFAMFLVLGLVILVAAFNVFGSLLLITMERTRAIAILESLGAPRSRIRMIFLLLGSVIGFVGTFAGLILGIATCLYIETKGITLPAEYYLRTLPVDVRTFEVIAVVAAALLAGLVATAYPANLASRLSPVEGLRND